jgi:Holliday junction DNA helicase RuvA
MIAKLTGTALRAQSGYLILDVHGVGYKVYASPPLLSETAPGTELSLWTHLVVREDVLDLYGFIDHAELELFKLLISVSGVGPRGALGILSLDKIDKLKRAIASSDVSYLTKVSGVGRKSAEKICVELSDKLGELGEAHVPGARSDEEDTLEALKSLGYRADEAREALKLVPDDITNQGAVIKEALKLLAK